MPEGISQDSVGRVDDAEGAGSLRCIHVPYVMVVGHWLLGQADEGSQVKRVCPVWLQPICLPDVNGEVWVFHRLPGFKQCIHRSGAQASPCLIRDAVRACHRVPRVLDGMGDIPSGEGPRF